MCNLSPRIPQWEFQLLSFIWSLAFLLDRSCMVLCILFSSVWASWFQYRIWITAHYYPRGIFVEKKRGRKEVVFLKITHAFTNLHHKSKIMQKLKCENGKITKKAHISVFFGKIAETSQVPNQKWKQPKQTHFWKSHWIKTFNFWLNNDLEKCFQAIQVMGNFHFFTPLLRSNP